jgi:hypothetical protein
MMPMATATVVKPHDPSAGTSTTRRALSRRKAQRPLSSSETGSARRLSAAASEGVGPLGWWMSMLAGPGVCAVVTAKMAADDGRARRWRSGEHPAGKGDIASHRRMLVDCRCEGSAKARRQAPPGRWPVCRLRGVGG